MKVFYDLDCLLHDPPHEILSGRLVPYLESPDRVRRIKDALTKSGSFELHLPEQNWPHDILHYVRMVHSEDYVNHIKNIYDEWVAEGGDESAVFPETFQHRQLSMSRSGRKLSAIARAGVYCFDLSCPITADTYNAAVASARVTLSAARALSDNRSEAPPAVFALSRPPGHHAQDALCGGYCFFNNAAIAAKYLLEDRGSGALAILDVDYHHGNGTQQIFYEDPRVLYVSLHADGDYPYFTGATDERGAGAGLGFNHNFPISRRACTDEVYCDTLQQAAEVIKKHTIHYLIVSLGVDTYQDDPICKPTLFVMEG
ncbi:Arginase/deacetylase [Trametes versicolor FP-101664 SS1]|uniref:Arginase/deacetylase n=1 Tax=Trametes versicolor (strain FP-101664) TaxID=717944 RepID=UPI00046236AB|nr:Arginase/deacetylase [Trametes versicolor FP-101664 SS1]EIW63806.1 Arginase/deacetylase [Trametes versicolor FP-101664 SS1]